MIARPTISCFLLLLAATAVASGQNVPVQTGSPVFQGFRIPTASGNLRYSVSASERASLGYSGQNQTAYSTALSGNVGFTTQSVLYPTSLVYSGGFASGTEDEPSLFFQTFSLSQSFDRKNYSVSLSDSFSYLPEAPSTGLSGLPGLGDLGTTPNPAPTLGVLTSATQITNASSAQYNRKLTGSTSVFGQGSYLMQRFLGGSSGLETDAYTVAGGATHRINALSSVTGQYSFNNFSYVSYAYSFSSQSAVLSYNRTLNRHLSVGFGGGPEIIGASPLSGTSAMINYRLNGSLIYTGNASQGTTASIGFARGTNGGQGLSFGAETDTLSATGTRRLGRSLGASGQFGYAKTSSFESTALTAGTAFASVNATSYVASGQINRAIARNLSAYVSYSFQRQNYSGQASGISPLNGNVQTLGIGITYSPESIHLGRQ